jgi:hypothetical protein
MYFESVFACDAKEDPVNAGSIPIRATWKLTYYY